MGDVFLDAFLDTLKILPFLLAVNLLLEVIEHRAKWNSVNRIMKGGIAPLIGAAVGTVPQCGFSVVATELYSKRKIALGTLLAVYIATSDEALPIMLSDFERGIYMMWPLLAIKVCFALVVGYSAFAVEKAVARAAAKKSARVAEDPNVTNADGKNANTSVAVVETDSRVLQAEAAEHGVDSEHNHKDGHDHDEEHHDDHVHIYGCHHHEIDSENAIEWASATKKQRAVYVWNTYIKHPLVHTATVIFFIFAVNVIFGIAVYYVGEARIAAFIGSTGYFQPFLAGAVGLIPNCAASVVITELYLVGGLNLGGAVAGLSVGAGIGYAVLVRHNRPVLDTVIIIVLMYTLSSLLGVAVNLVVSAL